MTKRVLLDESVPRHLANALDAAGFPTTPYPNDWKQLKNSELLTLAENHGFHVLVTSDKNIYAQQNSRGRKLAVVVLPTNRRRDIMQRASDIADTVRRIMRDSMSSSRSRANVPSSTTPPQAAQATKCPRWTLSKSNNLRFAALPDNLNHRLECIAIGPREIDCPWPRRIFLSDRSIAWASGSPHDGSERR